MSEGLKSDREGELVDVNAVVDETQTTNDVVDNDSQNDEGAASVSGDVEVKEPQSPSVSSPSFIQMFSPFSYGKSADSLGNIKEENVDGKYGNLDGGSGSKPTSPVIISHRRQPSGNVRKNSKRTNSIDSAMQAADSTSVTVSRKTSNVSVKDIATAVETPLSINTDVAESKKVDDNDQESLEPLKSSTSKQHTYSDDKYKDTDFKYASESRNIEFHEVFKTTPLKDRLLDEYHCTLSREFLYQGKLYISENYLCFNSSILGWVSKLVIPFKDIIFVEKTSAAGLFPNAISIETTMGKTQFNGFSSRDETFALLKEVWARVLIEDGEINSNSSRELRLKNDSKESFSESNALIIDRAINSIDEKTPDSDISRLQESDVTININKFKKNSGYTYKGPYVGETKTKSFETEGNEHALVDIPIDVAPGLAFKALFDDNITNFWTDFAAYSGDSFEYSEIPRFDKTDKEGHQYREYEYMKKLNYSVGPSSTKCYAKTTIIHLDYEDYIEVVNCVSTPDVPSGGSFNTMTRFIFVWDGQASTTSRFKVSFWVDWIGSSWIKSLVESSCQSGLSANFEKMKGFIVDYIHNIVSPQLMSLEMACGGTESDAASSVVNSESKTVFDMEYMGNIELQVNQLRDTCSRMQKDIRMLTRLIFALLVFIVAEVLLRK
ncbi:hypothetical protein TPHA_0P00170 [Tetrapisispora phaffii CBS 4417]|uniref:VASt domain-containing protein n=1 Tax=Tetrapisispora phaffii (strain ATCC 24235 / CBS 4417 / NBRC 1672 / NRRL Y-8282 / UCD 70-5) TaxID=1071381 RepID=G8C1Z7_TETPH|nr:hypothetical protein TPHA_0P00170 [Tetrapisispora phaffii CBS 4417]CCE66175.1 hypothetical protein TPHA_0P00170 [Tetrapisispora phaffii CBS 4417]